MRLLTYDQAQAVLHDEQYWRRVTGYTHPSAETTILSNDLESPYADEYTLSLRGAFAGNRGTVTFTYTNREYANLIESFQGGICDFDLDLSRPCPAANTTTVMLNGRPFSILIFMSLDSMLSSLSLI